MLKYYRPIYANNGYNMILKDFAKTGRVLTATLLILIFNLGYAYSSEPDSTRVIEHPLWEEEPVHSDGKSIQKQDFTDIIIPLGDSLSQDNNGNKWKTFHKDSLYIFLNTRYMQDHGRYYLIDLYVQNNSSKPLFFDFNSATVTANGKVNPFWSYDRYMSRIKRQNSWAAFGSAMAVMFTGWIMDAILNGSYYSGYADGYSIGLDILHNASSIFIQNIAYIGAIAIAEEFDKDYLRCVQANIGYLRPYNIPANSAVRGHALAKYIPSSDKVAINVPVGGKVYSFEWKTTDLLEIDSL